MGWFDDSDSDDTDSKSRKRRLELFDPNLNDPSSAAVEKFIDPLHTNVPGVQEVQTKDSKRKSHLDEDCAANDSNDEEGLDPLDSFMSSLSSTVVVSKSERNGNRGRLDVENEEEATAHWEVHGETSFQYSEEKKDLVEQLAELVIETP